MKRRNLIVLFLILSVLFVALGIYLTTENGIRATAEIGENAGQNSEIEAKQSDEYMVFDSREQLLAEMYSNPNVQAYVHFIRERFNPDYDPCFAPEGLDYSGTKLYKDPSRDEIYSEYFTGTYVKNESSKLQNVPFYSFEKLLFDFNISTFFLGLDSSRYEYQNAGFSFITSLMELCPNDEMREREDGSRYLVYNTDNNCKLFLMLSPDCPLPITVGFPILYKNELCYQNFAGIQPGDPMSKVSEIDDICEVYSKYWLDIAKVEDVAFQNTAEDGLGFSTVHYLTDGLLKIVYGSLNADGEPVVKEVRYYPDYVMETYTLKPLNYKINPLDLE